MPTFRLACLCWILVAGLTPLTLADDPSKVGERVERRGDEIVVCGQLVHTTAPVVTWLDPGGYDAYRTERRFGPLADSSFEKSKGGDLKTPNRFGMRKVALTGAQVEQVRGGGWDLPLLQDKVDQFVLHFDVCGTSKKCFEVLQDERGLSVHFMLDIDGTIYQTLDLKERAWHASKANDRSIGIEIANIGTFKPSEKDAPRITRWYKPDDSGHPRITVPTPGMLPKKSESMVLRPSRDEPVVGVVQNQEYAMYDLTPQQYDSLIKLTATLCKTFPKIKCDYPRDEKGTLIPPDPGRRSVQAIPGSSRPLPRPVQQERPWPRAPVGPPDRRVAQADGQ